MKVIYLIEEIRKQKKLTLKQLEKKSGVSKTHINDVERLEKEISLKNMILLAKALDKPMESLYKVKW